MAVTISQLYPKFSFFPYLHRHSRKIKVIKPNSVNFNVFVIFCPTRGLNPSDQLRKVIGVGVDRVVAEINDLFKKLSELIIIIYLLPACFDKLSGVKTLRKEKRNNTNNTINTV